MGTESRQVSLQLIQLWCEIPQAYTDAKALLDHTSSECSAGAGPGLQSPYWTCQGQMGRKVGRQGHVRRGEIILAEKGCRCGTVDSKGRDRARSWLRSGYAASGSDEPNV